jgi:hypothetical protein
MPVTFEFSLPKPMRDGMDLNHGDKIAWWLKMTRSALKKQNPAQSSFYCFDLLIY